MSRPSELPLHDELIGREVKLRGHQPHEGTLIELAPGVHAVRWRCAAVDCAATLLGYTDGRFAGKMLARACGPFRPVRRGKRGRTT
jgi:hypothetical protein